MLAVKNIGKYESLRHLSAVQQILAASKAKIYSASKGDLIVAKGDNSDFELFLLDGELKLVAQDGKETFIDTKSPNSNKAIAQLKPRRYDIIASTNCRYFVLNSQFVVGQEQDVDHIAGYYRAEISISQSISSGQVEFLEEFASELWGKNFYLPCLTNFNRVLREYETHGNSSKQWLVNIIHDDPGLALNLIACANDAVIVSDQNVESISEAVESIGVRATIELIQYFVRNNSVKKGQDFFWRRLQQIVIHSREVSFMAKGFASLFDNLDERKAYTAGLFHNIGEIALLTYIAKTKRFTNEDLIRNKLIEYRHMAGHRVLQDIGMPSEIIIAAKDSGNWFRESNELDYCDLVNVALLHCTMGRASTGTMPKLKDVPAFKRMIEMGLAPDRSMELLTAARNRTMVMAGIQPEAALA